MDFERSNETDNKNNIREFLPLDTNLTNNSVFKAFVHQDDNSQLIARQSFINMYIQSKYLELIAKNMRENDHDRKAYAQEGPLDLSIKTEKGLTSYIQQQDFFLNNFPSDLDIREVQNVAPDLDKATSLKHICDICGQKFNMQDRLAKHIASCHKQKRKHSDSGKNYECETCKRSFARSDMLTRHSRLHTGVKPYTCNICLQVFSRSDHLSTHQRTHTGEKPYKCPFSLCQYAACRRDMINRHLRTHVKNESKPQEQIRFAHNSKIPASLSFQEIKSEL